MSRFIDLTGQRFGRLTVVSRAENRITPSGGKLSQWECVCDCGAHVVVTGISLRSGNTQSCGCLRYDRAMEANRKRNQFRIVDNEVFVTLSNSSKEMVTDVDLWERYGKDRYWILGRNGYAITSPLKGQKAHYFHVDAFPDCPPDKMRDHISGDRLDNRRGNIRFVTRTQNGQNRGTGKNNTSGHVGVYWSKKERKWSARITVDGKDVSLGYFRDREDAIDAREAAEIKYFGEYRRKK